MAAAEEVQTLKEKGNECVRNKKYAEAVLHYTHAVKLDPYDYSLYSNRSLAFLKMQHFYFAMEDAKEAIKLKPDWAKGYFRKAEVEFSTFHFSDALISYGIALKLQPNDPDILNAMLKTSRQKEKDRKADDQIPWLGAGVGIIMGVIIVIADQILTYKPTLVWLVCVCCIQWLPTVCAFSNMQHPPFESVIASIYFALHPILMALLTIAVALIGYGVARGSRYYIKCQREALLEPPVDLLQDDNKAPQPGAAADTSKEERTHRSYTKAQARHRLKKGKSQLK